MVHQKQTVPAKPQSILDRCKGGIKRTVTAAVAVGTAVVVGTQTATAALTVAPGTISTGVEGGFDDAALIGVAIAGIVFVTRAVKKGLRLM